MFALQQSCLKTVRPVQLGAVGESAGGVDRNPPVAVPPSSQNVVVFQGESKRINALVAACAAWAAAVSRELFADRSDGFSLAWLFQLRDIWGRGRGRRAKDGIEYPYAAQNRAGAVRCAMLGPKSTACRAGPRVRNPREVPSSSDSSCLASSPGAVPSVRSVAASARCRPNRGIRAGTGSCERPLGRRTRAAAECRHAAPASAAYSGNSSASGPWAPSSSRIRNHCSVNREKNSRALSSRSMRGTKRSSTAGSSIFPGSSDVKQELVRLAAPEEV